MRTVPSGAAAKAAAAVLLVTLLATPAFAQGTDPVTRARALIEKKDAASAYSLRGPH